VNCHFVANQVTVQVNEFTGVVKMGVCLERAHRHSMSTSHMDLERPRDLSTMNVPNLMNQLQSEWDSAMLQIAQLKKQLEETQQQLATALYMNDGATRVIARLLKERDEAKAELQALKFPTSSPATSSSFPDTTH
jgi:hypothetical protein